VDGLNIAITSAKDVMHETTPRKANLSCRRFLLVALAHMICLTSVAMLPVRMPANQVSEIFMSTDIPTEVQNVIETTPPDAETPIQRDEVRQPIQERLEMLAMESKPKESFEEEREDARIPEESEQPPVQNDRSAISAHSPTDDRSSIVVETGDLCFWQSVRDAVSHKVRYPNIARQNGVQGFATVRMTVNAHGQLLDASVSNSSTEVFGESALSAVRRAAPFKAPTNAVDGTLVAVLPFRFQISGNN
jgi:TonB family protein